MHRLALLASFTVALGAGPALADGATFDNPAAAAAALVEALAPLDEAAVADLVGAGNESLVLSGEAERDRALAADFVAAFEAASELSEDGDGRFVLSVGVDAWPFPVPIVATEDGRWRFDAPAGREEMRTRTIGRNELDVIGLLRGYVQVQAAYRQIDYDDDGVMEFADAILSDPGARNGLYWPDDGTGPASPVGNLMARASAGGYAAQGQVHPAEPYAGYLFRILTRQGPQAPGGAYEYVVNGNMTAGHALFAYPAQYGVTGITSFLVGENGIVYEADLGRETAERARALRAYEPVGEWTRAAE